MAPAFTSGCDMFSSCWIRPRLERYCWLLERNSSSSCCFCRSCSLRMRCSLSRRCARVRYSDSSSSASCGALRVISSGRAISRPSASADRRSTRAVRARRSASLSPLLERKRVSSRRSSTVPLSTTWPSRTRISETMPPSRFWMTCTLLEGIALPSPVVTSSSTAKRAQTSATSNSTQATQTVTRVARGESSTMAPATSGMNSVSPSPLRSK
ncbi:hypothetical protein FQZ97_996040 [compost metagenome]